MKQKYLILSASIAAALASASSLAQPVSGINTTEAPRVVLTVNDTKLFTIPGTHIGFNVSPSSRVPDMATLNHLQFILKPSAQRQAALKQLIADQHNPQSPQFRQWLSPQQFGDNYGVTDADIAAVTSWLTSQGFTVNTVYPNKTQIDFSGNSGQVRTAFHTQENFYTLRQTINGTTTQVNHRSNNSDISVPAALQDVVVGVMGLNDFHVQPLAQKPHLAQWNPSKKSLELQSSADIARAKLLQQVALASGKRLSVTPVGYTGIRGLVPFDLMNMYGVYPLRKAGITGAGVTIAVVEDNNMETADWTNFVSTFNLAQYNGSISLIHPPIASGTNNCLDPDVVNPSGTTYYDPDDTEALLDAEWSTAIAPAANIWVATCADYSEANGVGLTTTNDFGGVFIAATNLINATAASARPNIISASYGAGEYFIDTPSKTQFVSMWEQADAEGISVFVSAGDSGSNPTFNGSIINGSAGNTAVDANALATTPYNTAVGGTDTVDVLDGTTSKYFAATTNAYGGSALGYVPEIPWNESCANGIAATAFGFNSGLAFCQAYLNFDPYGYYATSEGGSGGSSSFTAKPTWQSAVYDAAADTSRDVPDVSLFGGSFGGYTWVVICTDAQPCALTSTGAIPATLTTGVALEGGTSLSSPMFAGIQALVDQSLGTAGNPANQGNAAPTLYALAGHEYGTTTAKDPVPTTCDSLDNGNVGTSGCVFHNITNGTNSTQCIEPSDGEFSTANCFYYGTLDYGQDNIGLTSMLTAPTTYTLTNRAYTARPGWSFASGLGSVNAANLVAAWKVYVTPAGIVK